MKNKWMPLRAWIMAREVSNKLPAIMHGRKIIDQPRLLLERSCTVLCSQFDLWCMAIWKKTCRWFCQLTVLSKSINLQEIASLGTKGWWRWLNYFLKYFSSSLTYLLHGRTRPEQEICLNMSHIWLAWCQLKLAGHVIRHHLVWQK